MAAENDSSEVTREVRDIDKVLVGFCENNCLAATDTECDILLEVMPVGSWILKFRHNGLIVNCSEIILARPEFDATITFVTQKSFWSIVNYGGNIQDSVLRGNVRQTGSETALGVFNDRFLPSITVSVAASLGPTQLQQPLTSATALPCIPLSVANQLPLKTGFLLKKRDVLSGWRCRFFKVYHGRLDYFVGKFDALPRGSIDLLDAKVSLAGKATINGAEHWTLLVEPRRDRTCRLASDMVGDAGQAEAQTWQIVFRLAAVPLMTADPDPEPLQHDSPGQLRTRDSVKLELAKQPDGISSSAEKGSKSASVVGDGKGYKSSLLATSIVATIYTLAQHRYFSIAVGTVVLSALVASWRGLGLIGITLSVIVGALGWGVIALNSLGRVPTVQEEHTPSSLTTASPKASSAHAPTAGARSTKRSLPPEVQSPSPRNSPHVTAVIDRAPAPPLRSNSADLTSHSILQGAPAATFNRLTPASTTTARGSAIKLSSAIQGLFRRDNSARRVPTTTHVGATRSAVPVETVGAKRVSPLRDVEYIREGSGESDGGDTDIDRQSTCAQPSPTSHRRDRASANTSPTNRTRVVNFASPRQHLVDPYTGAISDSGSHKRLHPLVSDDECIERSRDLDESFSRPAKHLHRRSLSESSFSLSGYAYSGDPASSTPINSSTMRESFADDTPR